MRLKVLIVDDEALARSRLRTLLGECTEPTVSIEGEVDNAAKAMAHVQHHPVDVVLVDIHMPGADGLTLARALQALPDPPVVVFVTAYAEHAVQAFELDAADYLTKPVRLARLQASLQKIERLAQYKRRLEPDLAEEVMVIHERGRTERVPVSEVLYLKAELKYITVRTAARTYLLEGSLGELEEKYKPRFLRIHRNALIARGAVRALEKHHDPQEGEGWVVRLHGLDELLLVSRRQLAGVREVMVG